MTTSPPHVANDESILQASSVKTSSGTMEQSRVEIGDNRTAWNTKDVIQQSNEYHSFRKGAEEPVLDKDSERSRRILRATLEKVVPKDDKTTAMCGASGDVKTPKKRGRKKKQPAAVAAVMAIAMDVNSTGPASSPFSDPTATLILQQTPGKAKRGRPLGSFKKKPLTPTTTMTKSLIPTTSFTRDKRRRVSDVESVIKRSSRSAQSDGPPNKRTRQLTTSEGGKSDLKKNRAVQESSVVKNSKRAKDLNEDLHHPLTGPFSPLTRANLRDVATLEIFKRFPTRVQASFIQALPLVIREQEIYVKNGTLTEFFFTDCTAFAKALRDWQKALHLGKFTTAYAEQCEEVKRRFETDAAWKTDQYEEYYGEKASREKERLIPAGPSSKISLAKMGLMHGIQQGDFLRYRRTFTIATKSNALAARPGSSAFRNSRSPSSKSRDNRPKNSPTMVRVSDKVQAAASAASSSNISIDVDVRLRIVDLKSNGMPCVQFELERAPPDQNETEEQYQERLACNPIYVVDTAPYLEGLCLEHDGRVPMEERKKGSEAWRDIDVIRETYLVGSLFGIRMDLHHKTRADQIREAGSVSRIPKPNSSADTSSDSNDKFQEPVKKRAPRLPRSINDMNKAQLVRSLRWEHPIDTFNIGSLSANVKKSLSIKGTSKIQETIKEDVELATAVLKTQGKYDGKSCAIKEPDTVKNLDGCQTKIPMDIGAIEDLPDLNKRARSYRRIIPLQPQKDGTILVVGVNDSTLPRKYPICSQFVCQVNVRSLYCRTCRSYIHRDVMAERNICNIFKGIS
ncbi:hypothetical protein EDD11_007648 [Mortierella claussenii]|nr:hypothetical protein EDD11_007648 [Mortierella claussenii]